MKKSDKKTEQAIINALTDVCDEAKTHITGFEWLTHTVNYKNFPASLRVACVFVDAASQQQAIDQHKAEQLLMDIQNTLKHCDIQIKTSQISIDNEEACNAQHQGDWQLRLSTQWK